jgi:hypothetical protein
MLFLVKKKSLVKSTQVDLTQFPPEDGDRIQSPKRHYLNKRQNDA